MELYLEVHSKLVIEHNPGDKGSKHKETKFYLEVCPEMDKSKYVDHDFCPTEAGCLAITDVLVQSLIGNIHYAHESNFINDAEHLRSIIKKLEDGFVSITNVDKSTF